MKNINEFFKEKSVVKNTILFLMIGMLFVGVAFAEHTTDVSVVPSSVDTSQTVDLNFTATKQTGNNNLTMMKITKPSDWSNLNLVSCPAGWDNTTHLDYVQCSKNGATDIIQIQILFSATAPLSNTTNKWTIQTEDTLFAPIINTKNISVLSLNSTLQITPQTTNTNQNRTYNLSLTNNGQDNITGFFFQINDFNITGCSSTLGSCSYQNENFNITGITVLPAEQVNVSFNATAPLGAETVYLNYTINGSLGGTATPVPSSILVQTPPNITAVSNSITPVNVSENQTSVGFKINVTNNGNVNLTLNISTKLNFTDGSNIYTTTLASDNLITAGQTEQLIFNSANINITNNNYTPILTLYGNDSNTADYNKIIILDNNNITVQSPANLVVEALSSSLSKISKNENYNITYISFIISNTGQASANITSSYLSVLNSSFGNITDQYTITKISGDSMIGGGASTNYNYSLSPKYSATYEGNISINATINYTDTNTLLAMPIASNLGENVIISDFTAPDQPTGLNPPNLTYTNNPNVTFSWSNASYENAQDFLYYRIQVDNDSDFTSPENDLTNVFNSTTIYSMLESLYFWKIIAYDNVSNINLSLIYQLTVDTTAPLIKDLASNETDSVVKLNQVVNITVNATDLNDIESVNISGNKTNLSMTQNGNIWNITVNMSALGYVGDGQQTLTAYAVDNATNINWTTYILTIDDTTPLISNLYSNDTDNITRNDVQLIFYANFTENNTLNITLGNSTINQMNWARISRVANLTATPSSLGCDSDGLCILTANITDKADFSNITTYNITIDNTNPMIHSLTSNATGNKIMPASFINITVNATDTNIDYVEIGNYSSSTRINMTQSGDIWNATANSTQLGCGAASGEEKECNLTAIVYDFAGNSNSTNYTIYIDNKKPVANLKSIDNIVISPTASEGIKDNSTFKTNFTEKSEYNIFIVNSSNDLIKSIGSGNAKYTQNKTWNGSYTNRTVVPDGLYKIMVNLTDLAGNINNNQNIANITIDTLNPTVTVNSPILDSFTKDNTTLINITINPTGSEVDTTTLFVSINETTYDYDDFESTDNLTYVFNTTELNDGNHTIKINVTDMGGNSNNTVESNYTLDTIKPIITYSSGIESNNANKSQDNIFVNVSVTENNVKNIIFYLYNNTVLVENHTNTTQASQYSYNFTGLGNAVYYYNVTVTDISENQNNTEKRTITLDTQNPSIEMITPIESSSTNDNTTLVNFTINDTLSKPNISSVVASVGSVQYNYPNNITCTSLDNFYVCNFTTLELKQKTNTLQINASDYANNKNTTKISFTVDIENPNVVLNSPANKDLTGSTVDFNITATDNIANTLNCSLYLDGILNKTNSSVNNNTATTYQITEIPQGLHNWTVYCTDSAGNENESIEIRNITVDSKSPVFSNFGANDTYFNSSINVYVNVTDATLNITSVNITIVNATNSQQFIADPTGESCTLLSGNSYNCSVNWTGTGVGNYTFNITAKDNASNEANGIARDVWFVFDNTKPEAQITAPGNKNNIEKEIQINGTANDTNFKEYTINITNTTDKSIFSQTNDSSVSSELLANWNTSKALDGNYTITLSVVDKAGNTNTSAVNVTVDNNAPTAQIVGLSKYTQAGVGQLENVVFNVTWNGTDNGGSGISNYTIQYKINEGSYNILLENTTLTKTEYNKNNGGTVGSTYCFKVKATDNLGHIGEYSDEFCTTITAYNFTISLNTGWNLFSIPIVPLNTTISEVIKDIHSNITENGIWTYINGEWKTWKPGSILNNNLDTLTAGYGYWIQMKESENLTIYGSTATIGGKEGEVPNLPSRNIKNEFESNDWVLLGKYGINNANMSTALKSLIINKEPLFSYPIYFYTDEYYTIGENEGSDCDYNIYNINMTPGYGYWLAAKGVWN